MAVSCEQLRTIFFFHELPPSPEVFNKLAETHCIDIVNETGFLSINFYDLRCFNNFYLIHHFHRKTNVSKTTHFC